MDFSILKDFLLQHFPDAEIEITDLTGTRDHLGISIKSSAFQGKMLLAQHRMVMDALKEKLKSEIHAVQLKTAAK